MRILMTADTVGGVWTFAQELAVGLLERHCDVYLVSFGQCASAAQRNQCDTLHRKWGERFQFWDSDIPLEWMDANDRAYTEGAALLMRIADAFGPDALLSSQYCFGALPLKMPKLIVAHSDVLSWADSCRGGSLHDSAWLREYCGLVVRGLEAADAVVAPTHWMMEALARNFSLSIERIVIPNGRSIAGEENRPRKLQAITAGRLWDEAKNISTLRDVQSPMPVLIAGESAPNSRPTMNAQFLGALPSEELLDLFRESSVYVCASRYEPFGLAPLEAAQCGCAVVANDIPSLREVWEDGALYFCGAASLQAVLQELCASPEELHTARKRSMARARSFTADRMADAYLQLLNKLIAPTRGGVLCHAA